MKLDFGSVLYEDDYVELSEDILVIKKYFFPLMKPKIVRIRDLRVAYFDDQENAKYPVLRTWGKACNDVYWAVDFRRFVLLDYDLSYSISMTFLLVTSFKNKIG